jgi:hypothetical protein
MAQAAPVLLSPADPQPGRPAQGLAVAYAELPSHVRTLNAARAVLDRNAKPGTPIAGLSLDDTAEGDPVLTSGKSQQVGALISGYIRFDRAGTYTLDFLSNDGLEIAIGGQEGGEYDGIHSCGYVGEIEVEVPQAGYYALEATYFQRKGTACLMMEWGPDSDGLELVPDSALFHQP